MTPAPSVEIQSPSPASQPRRFTAAVWLKRAFLLAAASGSIALAMRVLRGFVNVGPIAIFLLDQDHREIWEAVAVLILVAIALRRAPRWRAALRLEDAARKFAANKTRAIALSAAVPMIVRLALLPALPVPEPLVADEFGHLLIADTFASGRVANPPNPMWRHFESIYVLAKPTYTSIYPVAQGLLLASAKVLRVTPWLAVWASSGIMCGLICWMLQGWLPPFWALLGALIAVMRFSLVSYWMNSYWGGALAAIGGALVLGSLPRIQRGWRTGYFALMGLGLAILSQTRPYEGFLLGVPLLLALWWSGIKQRRALQAILAIGATGIAIAGITLYYDWRVTGNPLVMPYKLHQKLYGTPQNFWWQPAIYDAEGIHRRKDIYDNFGWQLSAYQEQEDLSGLIGQLGDKSLLFWRFYLQPAITLALQILPQVIRTRKLRLLLLAEGMVFAGMALYPFFYYHYAAPVCGLTLLIVLECMRHLRAFRWRGRRTGRFLFSGLLAITLASFGLTLFGALAGPGLAVNFETARSQAMTKLSHERGRHLVLVRYRPDHLFHFGMVYNGANVDESPVIWARELDAVSNLRLLAYYPGRKLWLFEPDERPAKLVRIDKQRVGSSRVHISGLSNAARPGSDGRAGIAPGSIVTIFGRNLANESDGLVSLNAPFGSLPLTLVDAKPDTGNIYGFESPDSEGPDFSANTDPPPFQLADVQVRFGNLAARVLSVANLHGVESVTVCVPEELPVGTVDVQVARGEDAALVRGIQVLPANPGILEREMSDTGTRAIVVRAGDRLVSLEHPARRGEVLRVLVTGIPLKSPVIVGINNSGAEVLSGAYSSYGAGVEAVKFRMPWNTPRGADIPLAIAVNAGGRLVYGNTSKIPVE